MKRAHFVSALLATLVGLGVWLVGRGEERIRAERALDPGVAPERVVTVREPRLADPRPLLDDVAGTRSPAEAVEPASATRTSTAPAPGPASIRGRLVLPDGDALPAYFALDDVELDWRVPSSRRLVRYAETPRVVELETYDGDRYITFAHADGTFEYENAKVGVALELCVSGFGREQVLAIAPLAPGERRTLEVALELGRVVSGTVRDEQGEPLVGQLVLIERDASLDAFVQGFDEQSESCRTDADGRFAFLELYPAEWSLRVSGRPIAGADPRVVDVRAGSVRDLELVVRDPETLVCIVTWADGAPAEECTISVEEVWRSVRNAGEGEFELEILHEGPWRISAQARRPRERGSAVVEGVRRGHGPVRLVLRSTPLFEVRGRVVDAEGRALASCNVTAGHDGWGRTDSAGRFVLEIDAGEWELIAEKGGFRPVRRALAVPSPEASDVELVLERTILASGRVVDEHGDPIAGAEVRSSSSSARTLADGLWTVAVDPTDDVISASMAGYAGCSLEVRAGHGESVEDLVLHLALGCDVAGRVLDADGTPVFEAEVTLGDWTTWTNERGEFLWHDEPCGRQRLFATDPSTGRRSVLDVDLEPGRRTPVDLRLRGLDPTRLAGRITRGGRGVECSLFLRSDAIALDVDTAADGAFDLVLPCSGAVALWISNGERAWRRDLVVPQGGQADLRLDLDALAEIAPDALDW